MATRTELIRKQVTLGVALRLDLTFEQAADMVSGHNEMIDAWTEGQVPVELVTGFLVDELRPQARALNRT